MTFAVDKEVENEVKTELVVFMFSVWGNEKWLFR